MLFIEAWCCERGEVMKECLGFENGSKAATAQGE